MPVATWTASVRTTVATQTVFHFTLTGISWLYDGGSGCGDGGYNTGTGSDHKTRWSKVVRLLARDLPNQWEEWDPPRNDTRDGLKSRQNERTKTERRIKGTRRGAPSRTGRGTTTTDW